MRMQARPLRRSRASPRRGGRFSARRPTQAGPGWRGGSSVLVAGLPDCASPTPWPLLPPQLHFTLGRGAGTGRFALGHGPEGDAASVGILRLGSSHMATRDCTGGGEPGLAEIPRLCRGACWAASLEVLTPWLP